MLLPAAAFVVGCDDNSDDDPDLFVVSVNPGDQTTNVATGSNVVVRFSIPPDPASFSGNQIILVDQGNSQQPISITVDATYPEIITLTPVTPLATNVTYGVAIRELITDYNSKDIQPPFASRFSTGPTLASIPGFPPFTLPPGPVPPPGSPGTFTPTGQLVAGQHDHKAVRLLDGTVLICGGTRGNNSIRDAQIYNPVTGTWRYVDDVTTSNPLGKQGMNFRRQNHTATMLTNGTVLVTGGTDGSVTYDTAELYDPSTDSFAVLSGRMVWPRDRHQAVRMDNGNVLLMGGGAPGVVYNRMEVYDVTSGTFNAVQSQMTVWRDQPAAIRQPDGRVFMCGGMTPAFLFGFTIITIHSGETYSPTAGTVGTSGTVMTCGNRMSTTRWFHEVTEITAGPAAGLVIVTGGDSNNPWQITLRNAEVYDYLEYNGAGGFRPIAEQMATPRSGHTATFLSNDQVVSRDGRGILVVGGFTTNFLAPQTPLADIFDPFGGGSNVTAPYRGVDQSGTFRIVKPQGQGAPPPTTTLQQMPVPPLACGLALHTATPLLNGTVLHAGGVDSIFCVIPFTSALALIYSP